MGRGHPLDALLFQRPVVDPFGSACPFQRSVCHRRPLGTPVVNFAGSLVVQLAGFIGQTSGVMRRVVSRMWAWWFRSSPPRPGAWMQTSAATP